MHGLFRWSSKWWPGLIPLALFWIIACCTSTDPLEADLAARSGAALKDTVLDKTRIAVDGRDVTLGADAFSEDGCRGAVALVQAVPCVRLVNDETRLVPEAKPFVWSAERDVVRVTLGGSAPLPATKGRLLEAARASLGGVEVVDQMNLARGAPSGFAATVVPALGELSRLSTGTLVVSDREVKLSGDALYDAAAAEIRSGLSKEFPQGFQYKDDISIKPAAAPVDGTVCQQLFSELLSKGSIRFEPARASIDPDSAGLLDRLIETALRCPGTNIEIAGHTDTGGDGASNQMLSDKRAQAV